jgi:hypothetical protein
VPFVSAPLSYPSGPSTYLTTVTSGETDDGGGGSQVVFVLPGGQYGTGGGGGNTAFIESGGAFLGYGGGGSNTVYYVAGDSVSNSTGGGGDNGLIEVNSIEGLEEAPEPSSCAMLLLGLGAAGFCVRHKLA